MYRTVLINEMVFLVEISVLYRVPYTADQIISVMWSALRRIRFEMAILSARCVDYVESVLEEDLMIVEW